MDDMLNQIDHPAVSPVQPTHAQPGGACEEVMHAH